jgi:hypothetical protein
LDIARRRQLIERESMMAGQAKAERDDFLRVIQRQKEDELKERELNAEKQFALRSNADVIR